MLDPGTQDLGNEEDKIHGSFHEDINDKPGGGMTADGVLDQCNPSLGLREGQMAHGLNALKSFLSKGRVEKLCPVVRGH